MKRYGLLFVPALLFLMAGAATTPRESEKELIIRLQGEVIVLQRQIRDLQESFDKSQGQTSPLLQKIADQAENTMRTLPALEEAFKNAQTTQSNNLTGATARLAKLSEQLGQNEQRFNQISSQIKGLRDHLDQQIQVMQRRLEAEKEAEKQAQVNLPQFTNPEQLYAFAYGQFTKGNYEQAVTNFRRYIEAYGHTEAADNAQFWIAESFHTQSRYNEALREYDRLLIDYPKGDKTAAANLKKGITLLQLERREEGVAALRAVITLYPHAQEAAVAAQELSRLGEPAQPAPTPAPTNKIKRF
jgi:tol-pal system protein YbgF